MWSVSGTEVGRVTAIDRDGPPFNRFVYTLMAPADDAESATFVLNPDTGVIRTTVTLDRERQAVYRLTVVATELAHPRASSTANVTVLVADRNDNRPIIVEPSSTSNQSCVVSLYASPGHVFARVTATDLDWGLNARLRYSIIAGGDQSAAGAFDIGTSSGAVSVRRDLSLVLPAHLTRLSLVVLVRDSGLPRLNATVTLSVLIDRSTRTRDSSPHGHHPTDRGDWLTSLSGQFRREFLIVLAVGSSILIIVLLMAIVCIRRRQLAVLAGGGADQVQPQRAPGNTKSLPQIVEVGWTTDVDDATSCRTSNCESEFQIVRNIVDTAPWQTAATLQSPSRVMSATSYADDPQTHGTSTTGRLQQRTPQLQTFSVSLSHLLDSLF